MFRNAVGIVVFNKDKKVLMCARKDFAPKIKHWQFPQGGVEPKETILDAAKRELAEETSISSVRFVASLNTPLFYKFPKNILEKLKNRKPLYEGQKMHWLLFYFYGQEEEINLQTKIPEFIDWQWTDIVSAPQKIVYFKKRVYKTVVRKFSSLIEDFIIAD